MHMLCTCSVTYHIFTQTDFETIDYINELREGCLEAYTGIAQGLKGEGDTVNGQSILSLVPRPHPLRGKG